MTEGNDRALVRETKALIKEVEAGDTDHAAWIAIQDRVKLLTDERTQIEVGELLEKKSSWIGYVLRWDRHRGGTPFANPNDPGKRGRESAAKKVLRDPEQRREVIESLTEEEQTEIALAAMEPMRRREERGHKENEAHRESKPARERGVIELISAQLDMADLNIHEAIRTAKLTAWDDAEINAMAESRVDRTAMRLDLLRMVIRSEGDISAELAKIEEEN